VWLGVCMEHVLRFRHAGGAKVVQQKQAPGIQLKLGATPRPRAWPRHSTACCRPSLHLTAPQCRVTHSELRWGHDRAAGSVPVSPGLPVTVSTLRCGAAPASTHAAGNAGPVSELLARDSTLACTLKLRRWVGVALANCEVYICICLRSITTTHRPAPYSAHFDTDRHSRTTPLPCRHPSPPRRHTAPCPSSFTPHPTAPFQPIWGSWTHLQTRKHCVHTSFCPQARRPHLAGSPCIWQAA